ncbi:hypothetical protein EXIGLDRAFT_42977 [Exidia glandulosa HHB12029]|uniref:Uncharacterized protein n=1 Tax=Exidia glandulosa HHB12029 TaxID=1314781 RepID=A0A165IJE8_EXIGL|nr:hypothetical protein EXIGLDRAFT_42977 [Exidia glandulosa HHB12029]
MRGCYGEVERRQGHERGQEAPCVYEEPELCPAPRDSRDEGARARYAGHVRPHAFAPRFGTSLSCRGVNGRSYVSALACSHRLLLQDARGHCRSGVADRQDGADRHGQVAWPRRRVEQEVVHPPVDQSQAPRRTQEANRTEAEGGQGGCCACSGVRRCSFHRQTRYARTFEAPYDSPRALCVQPGTAELPPTSRTAYCTALWCEGAAGAVMPSARCKAEEGRPSQQSEGQARTEDGAEEGRWQAQAQSTNAQEDRSSSRSESHTGLQVAL